MAETKTKLINGVAFEVSQPYSAGHTINEAEAKTLNQVRAENIGNNLRDKIKELCEAGNEAGARELFAEKDASYVFTFSVGGGGSRKLDPIEREARAIARDLIKATLANSGRKITVAPEGKTEDEWKEAVEAEVDRISATEEVLKVAKKNVADKQKRADSLLASIGGVSV